MRSGLLFENGTDDLLLGVGDICGKLNLEGQDEVAASVVVHQSAQRVLVVDGHALAWEDFFHLGRDDLVRVELDDLAVQGLKLYYLDRKGVDEGDLVTVDQIVAYSANRLVLFLLNRHHQIAFQSVFGMVAQTCEP